MGRLSIFGHESQIFCFITYKVGVKSSDSSFTPETQNLVPSSNATTIFFSIFRSCWPTPVLVVHELIAAPQELSNQAPVGLFVNIILSNRESARDRPESGAKV